MGDVLHNVGLTNAQLGVQKYTLYGYAIVASILLCPNFWVCIVVR